MIPFHRIWKCANIDLQKLQFRNNRSIFLNMHNTTVLFYSRPTMEELWCIWKGKSQLKIKFHWLMNWSERTQLWVFVVVVINNLRPFQKLVHFVIFAGLREKMYQHWKSRPSLKLQYKVQFAVDILTFKTKFYIKLKLAFLLCFSHKCTKSWLCCNLSI